MMSHHRRSFALSACSAGIQRLPDGNDQRTFPRCEPDDARPVGDLLFAALAIGAASRSRSLVTIRRTAMVRPLGSEGFALVSSAASLWGLQLADGGYWPPIDRLVAGPVACRVLTWCHSST